MKYRSLKSDTFLQFILTKKVRQNAKSILNIMSLNLALAPPQVSILIDRISIYRSKINILLCLGHVPFFEVRVSF